MKYNSRDGKSISEHELALVMACKSHRYSPINDLDDMIISQLRVRSRDGLINKAVSTFGKTEIVETMLQSRHKGLDARSALGKDEYGATWYINGLGDLTIEEVSR